MNYTEEDLRNAFVAGTDAQYENDFNLTLKEEENKFVNELIEIKKLSLCVVNKRSKLLICKNNEQHTVHYYKNTKQKVCMVCGEQ